MNVAFLTLGCKVNKYETDLLKEKFEKAGHFMVDFDTKADMYCINSCSVTNMSDRKTRQMISKARSKNPNAIIAVVGCSVEGEKASLSTFNGVDIILGNEDKSELLKYVEEFSKDKKKKITLRDISEVKKYTMTETRTKGYEIRETIKIEDGCNNFCSYCIIPYTRGKVRSREIASIIKEAKSLASCGVKEIVLVGIEVASYGIDLENTNLFDVLNELEKIQGIERIRLSSLEPRFLNIDNIIKLSSYKKLCPHFHISMQSGNDDVLKRMNRKYTKCDLVTICNNLRKYFSDPYLAADVIVGFPLESNEEFEDTVKTIKEMKLSEIHVFKYSKRNYTRAAKMDGQVDGNIKKIRSEKIIELSRKNNKEFLSKYIGKKVDVLFENYTNGILKGYTPNYIMVKVKGEEALCGTIQGVVITSLERGMLLGNLD